MHHFCTFKHIDQDLKTFCLHLFEFSFSSWKQYCQSNGFDQQHLSQPCRGGARQHLSWLLSVLAGRAVHASVAAPVHTSIFQCTTLARRRSQTVSTRDFVSVDTHQTLYQLSPVQGFSALVSTRVRLFAEGGRNCSTSYCSFPC